MIRSLFQKIFLNIKSSKFFSDTFIWRMVALGVFFDLLLLFYLKSKISHLGDIIDYASLLGSGYREMLENGAFYKIPFAVAFISLLNIFGSRIIYNYDIMASYILVASVPAISALYFFGTFALLSLI